MATGIQRTTGPVGKKFGMIPWVECETIITYLNFELMYFSLSNMKDRGLPFSDDLGNARGPET